MRDTKHLVKHANKLAENKKETETSNSIFVQELKIFVRDLSEDDISKRNIPKNTTGVVITKILEGSPLVFVSVNDIIVETQKKKIKNSKQFSTLIKQTILKGEKTLYLAVYNSSNQRSYITVKLK